MKEAADTSWPDSTYSGAPDECGVCFRGGIIVKYVSGWCPRCIQRKTVVFPWNGHERIGTAQEISRGTIRVQLNPGQSVMVRADICEEVF